MESKPAKHSGAFPLRWHDIFLLRIIPPLAALLIKMLLISCRVIRVEGRERDEKARAESDGVLVYATWHQRMSYSFHYFGPRHVTVMISQSRDGEYVSRIAKWLGFRNVRGSSTRGGMDALKEMIQKIRAGRPAGMLADGPLGPARVAKIGAVILARDTQVPLVPITWSADRCWILNSWDRYMIPKPFARVVWYYGEPIRVPPKVRREELESFRILLEDSLNRGTTWCDAQFGAEKPWRKVKEKGVPEIGPLPSSSM